MSDQINKRVLFSMGKDEALSMKETLVKLKDIEDIGAQLVRQGIATTEEMKIIKDLNHVTSFILDKFPVDPHKKV